jgi:hypothetical protein
LGEVADIGFRAFHDLPAEPNWNIDHVAVGTRGVFLLETKARRRRPSRNGQAEHKVIYNGKALQFPAYSTSKPVEQAQRNAEWLAKYLEKRTATPVKVKPLVVLPGWYVDYEGKPGYAVDVMNANYLTGYLRGQEETLAVPQVRRIIAALEDKCRDLEF